MAKRFRNTLPVSASAASGSPAAPARDDSEFTPAKALASPAGRIMDPTARVPSLPPNAGQMMLPHVATFQGIVSNVSRVYKLYDEATKHSPENARFMLNDIAITECLEQRQRSCALLNWHIEVDDSTDPREKQLANNLTKLLNQIPRFMQFRESLLDALWLGKNANQWQYGWKPVHGADRVRGHMGNICITKWLPVHGDKIVFRFDTGNHEYDPNQIGIRVGAGYMLGDTISGRMDSTGNARKVEPTDYGLAYFLEPFERRQIAVHKHLIKDGEYEDVESSGKIHGLGIRSRIYWAWYQKQECLSYLLEFLERSASGLEIWYYPWGNPEAEAKTRQAAQDRIGNSRNIILMPRPVDEGGVSPYGVDKLEPGMAGAQALQSIIQEYFGQQLKRYILGQTLTSEAAGTGLGSNLATIHLDTYLQIVRYDSTNLEETMTTDVVEQLKIANYPEDRDIPTRFRIDTESADVEGKLSAMQQAYQMGLKIKSQDLMDCIGVSKPEEDDDVLESPEHIQANMQIQQMQQQMQQQAAMQQQQQQQMAAQQQAGQAPGGAGPAQVQGGLGGDEGGMPPGQPGPADQGQQPQQYAAANRQGQQSELARGAAEEQEEHGISRPLAERLAADHLDEDDRYYEKVDAALASPESENSERMLVEKAAAVGGQPAPAKYSLPPHRTRVIEAAEQTHTEPTEAQIAAGNYRKGLVYMHGLAIRIENPRGTVRKGKNKGTGKAWESPPLPTHYGYIVRASV